MAHLEPPIPFGYASSFTITDDILEGVATPPLATIPSTVPFHRVCFGEVVPRSDKMHNLNRGMCLS